MSDGSFNLGKPMMDVAPLVDSRLGKVIKEERLSKGVTSADLASAIGCSPVMLIRYESGTVRLSAGLTYAIAEALGTDISSLIKKAAS